MRTCKPQPVTDSVSCPHCGKDQGDPYFITRMLGPLRCFYCKKPYMLTVFTTYTTSEVKEGENEGQRLL